VNWPTQDSNHQHQVVEGLSLQLKRAPLGKRALALAVDWGIIMGCLMISVAVLGVLAAFVIPVAFSVFGASPVLMVVGVIVVSLVLLGLISGVHAYFVWFEFKRQATPGKKLFGISIISLEGGPLSLRQCVIRECLRYVDMFLYIPGLVAILATEKSQRLGDMMAGTMLVHSATEEGKNDYLYLSQAEFHSFTHEFEPPLIPEEMATEFLKFAYPSFVFPGRELTVEEEEAWVEYAKNCLPGLSQFEQRRLALLFFAEMCFQQKRVAR